MKEYIILSAIFIMSYLISKNILKKKIEYEDYAKKYIEAFTYILYPFSFLLSFNLIPFSLISFILFIKGKKNLSIVFLLIPFLFSSFKEMILILAILIGLWEKES